MSPLWIVVGIIIACYVIYRIVCYYQNKSLDATPNRVGPEKIDLSSVVSAIPSAEFQKAWNNTNGATLQFFIYPTISDRTSRTGGNEYATIFTAGTGEAAPLSLKILVTPDAGRGYSLAPAQLIVSEVNGTPEKIDLPEIPLQRWTSIIIVREGRKFNIYFNGTLTTSHMCTATPSDTGSNDLSVGDTKLTGTIALMTIASHPLDANDVRSYVKTAADTTGAPYLSSGMSLPVPTLSDIEKIFTCPFGNCSSAVSKAGPLQQWSSPYA